MRTLTQEETLEIEKKNDYVEEKASLLQEYKSYAENIEFADDDFEEDMIMQKREKLAVKIKDLGVKIREIESLETQA